MARTLQHLRCCVALAIRCWRRRTILSACSSCCWDQGRASWGTAPGWLEPVICNDSLAEGPEEIVGETRGKSPRLRAGAMLSERAQPLSTRLQGGVRFLLRPLPAVPTACLAARFPGPGSRETTGLPRFAGEKTTRLGVLYPPAALYSEVEERRAPTPAAAPFGPGLSASWAFSSNDGTTRIRVLFTMRVTLAPGRQMLSATPWPRGLDAPWGGMEYVVRGASHA